MAKKEPRKKWAVPAPCVTESGLRRSHYKTRAVARNYISMPWVNELFVRLKAFAISQNIIRV